MCFIYPLSPLMLRDCPERQCTTRWSGLFDENMLFWTLVLRPSSTIAKQINEIIHFCFLFFVCQKRSVPQRHLLQSQEKKSLPNKHMKRSAIFSNDFFFNSSLKPSVPFSIPGVFKLCTIFGRMPGFELRLQPKCASNELHTSFYFICFYTVQLGALSLGSRLYLMVPMHAAIICIRQPQTASDGQ